MDNSINPNNRVIREEEVVQYDQNGLPIQRVAEVQPVVPVQPVQQVVQPVQPVQQVVQPVQPVYQPIAQPVAQPVVQRVVQPVVPVHRVVSPEIDTRQTHADYGNSKLDNVKETYLDEQGNVMERQQQIFDDPYTRRMNTLDRTSQIIYFLFGALEILLLVRFVFKLLGADPNSGVAALVYGLTNPFVFVFNGILNDNKVASNSVLELSTLIAMALYALIAWGIVSMLNAFLTPNPSSRQVFTSTRRKQ